MDKVFAFDMDGVIADTLGALYRCYLDLLAAHGVEGTEAEFNQLNGPKISEIVSYLKQTYQLPASEEALQAEYLQRIERVYDDVQPVHNVLPVIEQLQKEGVPLALASQFFYIDFPSFLTDAPLSLACLASRPARPHLQRFYLILLHSISKICNSSGALRAPAAIQPPGFFI